MWVVTVTISSTSNKWKRLILSFNGTQLFKPVQNYKLQVVFCAMNKEVHSTSFLGCK